MSAPVLIVEQRLRVVLVYLDALKHIATLAEEPVRIPQFADPREFARWVADMAVATANHVSAIRAALPADSATVDAPVVGRTR